MDEVQLSLTGKTGNQYVFFPRFHFDTDASSRGSGIYVFLNRKEKIVDIQFLSNEEDIGATLRRMKGDGVVYFYFKDSVDELQSDADIDDIKGGEEYREKID